MNNNNKRPLIWMCRCECECGWDGFFSLLCLRFLALSIRQGNFIGEFVANIICKRYADPKILHLVLVLVVFHAVGMLAALCLCFFSRFFPSSSSSSSFIWTMSHEIWARLITLFNQNYETDNEINIVKKTANWISCRSDKQHRDRLAIINKQTKTHKKVCNKTKPLFTAHTRICFSNYGCGASAHTHVNTRHT